MLNQKETQLILKVLEGKTSKDISKEMYLSVRWIEEIRGNIIRKLDCKNFYEAIGVCFKNGWIRY